MESYKNCNLIEPEDDSFVLEEMLTPHGIAEFIYFGPGGVYVIMSDSENPSVLYEHFRNLLGTAKIKIYFVGKGEYLSSSASFSGEVSPDELDVMIYDYIHAAPRQYTRSSLERMKAALIRSDAGIRGRYTADDGTVYVLRYGEFNRASEINPEHVLKLCLFGGTLGLHRFALGKWFTGLFYFLTGGMFLLGWLLDLIQIFFGFQKDKHKPFVSSRRP